MLQDFYEFITNFDSMLKTIVTAVLIIGVLFYFFFRKFKMVDTNYNSQEYWEGRYGYYTTQFDWYVSLNDLSSKFQLNKILEKKVSNKKSKILELGCGNSPLSYDVLYNFIIEKLTCLGYKSIYALDFSNTVINNMKNQYFTTPIKCNITQTNNLVICGDINRLNELFEKDLFDMVIEKASFDSIFSIPRENDLQRVVRNMFTKIHYILKPNGIHISVSIKNKGKKIQFHFYYY